MEKLISQIQPEVDRERCEFKNKCNEDGGKGEEKEGEGKENR